MLATGKYCSGCWASAGADTVAARGMAAAYIPVCARCHSELSFMLVSLVCVERTKLSGGTSMPERTQAQPLLGQLPQPRQTERLEDQETDDHCAEDDLLHSRDDTGVDAVAEQAVEHNVEQNGGKQDEGGTQERAHDGADAADDDHEQDAERQVDVESRGLDGLQIGKSEERTADAAV